VINAWPWPADPISVLSRTFFERSGNHYRCCSDRPGPGWVWPELHEFKRVPGQPKFALIRWAFRKKSGKSIGWGKQLSRLNEIIGRAQLVIAKRQLSCSIRQTLRGLFSYASRASSALSASVKIFSNQTQAAYWQTKPRGFSALQSYGRGFRQKSAIHTRSSLC